MSNDTPLDRPLLNRLAEAVMFGPQTEHAKIRHNALMQLTEAYRAGYLAGKAAAVPAKETG